MRRGEEEKRRRGEREINCLMNVNFK